MLLLSAASNVVQVICLGCVKNLLFIFLQSTICCLLCFYIQSKTSCYMWSQAVMRFPTYSLIPLQEACPKFCRHLTILFNRHTVLGYQLLNMNRKRKTISYLFHLKNLFHVIIAIFRALGKEVCRQLDQFIFNNNKLWRTNRILTSH